MFKRLCYWFSHIYLVYSIRVCKTEFDYFIPFNDNCWDTPASDMTVAEVARDIFGFKAENHEVVTKDGYVLSIERFYLNISKENPVICGHGTASNGFAIIAAMENSLGYLLAMEGYDVWVIHFRGTRFSRKHTKYSVDDEAFWDFSFHEVGLMDLQTVVTYVNKISKKKALYVGISTGCAAYNIYSSLMPEEAKQKLLGAVLIVPAGVFVNNNSTLDDALYLLQGLTIIGSHKGAYLFDGLWRDVGLRLLITNPISIRILLRIVDVIDVYQPEQIDWSTTPSALMGVLDISTFKILSHYTQGIETNEFSYFDYGVEKNLQKYGQKIPPQYPLNKIEIPTATLTNKGDPIAPMEGVRKLYYEYTDESKCGFLVVKKIMSHGGMIIGKDVKDEVNVPILNILKRMEKGTCKPE